MAGQGGGSTSLSDLVGSTIQGYRLGELIGKGGMAWVYKARHLKLGEDMAVKVLLIEPT